MKLFDKVKVLVSKPEYEEQEVYKGMVGTIIDAEIRFRAFQVIFTDPTPVTSENWDYIDLKDDILCYIHVKDLEVVEESDCTDEYLLENLPNQDIRWFCKVEDGFITNLLGEKLNKIPYDYNSWFIMNFYYRKLSSSDTKWSLTTAIVNLNYL